jgi:RNA polymerase sigma-54 factor
MKPSLQLRLSQHLALTPQLQQSIRLLQLSTLELNQEIEQAMADNPLLERDDDPLAVAVRVKPDGSIATGESAPSEAAPEPINGHEAAEVSTPGEFDSLVDWGGRGEARIDEDDGSPLDWAGTTTTLKEHLLSQISCTQASARDRALVELLIEALDEDGYLQPSLEEILALCPAEAGIEPEEISAALCLLQSFDPAGVGARNVSECLQLQLRALARAASGKTELPLLLARRIVSDHLQLLAAREFPKLRKFLDCTDDELRAAHQLIRTLRPRPGVAFADTHADYVVPDVFVRRVRSRWTAVLNPEVMPRLRVNQAYADILKKDRGRGADPGERGQWTTRVQEARWLIRNIQQRFETILRVAQAIVDRQHNFFTHGEIAMRPLVLREIADTVGLHESTISRVTANKYMATPLGVFELKFFFGSHVATEAGGAASSTAIRALIKQLIGAEDTRNPLSDSRLAELLGEQGIVVARRTVAKYRESMKIPAVAMRKSL